jgi:hypothetical protein
MMKPMVGRDKKGRLVIWSWRQAGRQAGRQAMCLVALAVSKIKYKLIRMGR